MSKQTMFVFGIIETPNDTSHEIDKRRAFHHRPRVLCDHIVMPVSLYEHGRMAYLFTQYAELNHKILGVQLDS